MRDIIYEEDRKNLLFKWSIKLNKNKHLESSFFNCLNNAARHYFVTQVQIVISDIFFAVKQESVVHTWLSGYNFEENVQKFLPLPSKL